MRPCHMGPAILKVLKQGKKVERITVWFTHGQIHKLFTRDISDKFPLEMTLAEGTSAEEKIDLRLSLAPWHIDVRTKKEKAKVPYVTPDPKPPEDSKMDSQIAAAIAALLEPFSSLIEWEYRLLTADLQRRALKEQVARQRQARVEDTAHAQ